MIHAKHETSMPPDDDDIAELNRLDAVLAVCRRRRERKRVHPYLLELVQEMHRLQREDEKLAERMTRDEPYRLGYLHGRATARLYDAKSVMEIGRRIAEERK